VTLASDETTAETQGCRGLLRPASGPSPVGAAAASSRAGKAAAALARARAGEVVALNLCFPLATSWALVWTRRRLGRFGKLVTCDRLGFALWLRREGVATSITSRWYPAASAGVLPCFRACRSALTGCTLLRMSAGLGGPLRGGEGCGTPATVSQTPQVQIQPEDILL
jgi:hypothetical protein